MELKGLLGKLGKQLADARIDCALIGGLAVGQYGYPRFTNDIDLLVRDDDRERLKATLVGSGYSVFAESEEFLQLQGPCAVDFQFAKRPLSQRMLNEAVMIPSLGVKCLRADDIIGLKIQSYANNSKREFKEKADIQALIEHQKESLDWARIRQYAELFQQWPAIEVLKKKAGA